MFHTPKGNSRLQFNVYRFTVELPSTYCLLLPWQKLRAIVRHFVSEIFESVFYDYNYACTSIFIDNCKHRLDLHAVVVGQFVIYF